MWKINDKYPDKLNKLLCLHPDAAIFLLTDCEDILEKYKSIYGTKIIYTDCTRSKLDCGIYQLQEDGYILGVEILKDTFLALKCDYFIGNTYSNVFGCYKTFESMAKRELVLAELIIYFYCPVSSDVGHFYLAKNVLKLLCFATALYIVDTVS